ncbi:MAG: DUF6596 domain-containing protein [Steroidobacter sp.]
MELEAHLFRREAGRIVAILARLFGIHNLSLVEDVVQEAFCRALETWKFHGVPQNPSGWLMTTAKNRALDMLRRERTERRFASEYQLFLESEWTLKPTVDEAFSGKGLNDAQLRMMFTCVDPEFPEETQIALVLNLVCGFGADEIAAAFLKSVAAMQKRLTRGKNTLAQSRQLFELINESHVMERLPTVMRAIYLLFNEGYHGNSQQQAVRGDLCEEALRLAALLAGYATTRTPALLAMNALFHFLLARLPGRLDMEGNLLLLVDQDRSNWDQQRIAEGRRLLDLAAMGSEVSPYHLEAGIAALHTDARSVEETDWQGIVSLYDILMTVQPSPVVALNRAIAVAQRDGAQAGLEQINQILDGDRLSDYPYFFAALAELELRLGHFKKAQDYFNKALKLVRNPPERRFILKRIEMTAQQLCSR